MSKWIQRVKAHIQNVGEQEAEQYLSLHMRAPTGSGCDLIEVSKAIRDDDRNRIDLPQHPKEKIFCGI